MFLTFDDVGADFHMIVHAGGIGGGGRAVVSTAVGVLGRGVRRTAQELVLQGGQHGLSLADAVRAPVQPFCLS